MNDLRFGVPMKTTYAIVILASVLIGGCTVFNFPNRQTQQQQQQTQLQTRQYQQREYDTNDVKLVMKAVLNTLQDDGFFVKNAVVDLGLISATKEISLKNQAQGVSDDFWSVIFKDAMWGRGKNTPARTEQKAVQNIKQIDASVNISEFGKNQTRVRVSFQARILDTNGSIMESGQIEDMKFYQEFFLKVDKGIFIEKQKF